MTDSYNEKMLATSHLSGSSSAYIDHLYEAYLSDPDSVDEKWRAYFSNLPLVEGQQTEHSHHAIQEAMKLQARQPAVAAAATPAGQLKAKKQAHVLQLINAFRSHGHHQANLDPLAMSKRVAVPDLSLAFHDLNDADLNDTFSTESLLTRNGAKLRDIYQYLQDTYCGSIGVEIMHITDSEQLKWLQDSFEGVHGKPKFSAEKKQALLKDLTAAEGLEKYLGSKYVGQKRFSLEGGESFIPLLHELIAQSGLNQVKEVIIGMAHRGRLNVLVNVLGKAPDELFEEFEGKSKGERSGDVKYHMGFSSDVKTEGGNVHLAMAFNPSHLEIIGPVVEGSSRARLRRRGDLVDKKSVLPVVVHGDAAFAGQGVVMETFNFSQARGYSTGGTVHIVINNQIGFTTSNPLDARSTLYCTDVAKMVQAPIIHVNSDDPEAVVFAAQVAFDYRMRFGRDVVIDLVCYRRHGHNEADEPSVTQPAMYQHVRALKTTRQLYADKCIAEGVLDKEAAEGFIYTYRDALDKGDAIVKTVTGTYHDKYAVDWSPYADKRWDEKVVTAISNKELQTLTARLATLPDDFTMHPVVKRLFAERDKMTRGEIPINWGYAEVLAYASLVKSGYPVRLSGQDCGRGTFAHRHAVLHDYKTAEDFIPLEHISEEQEQFIIIDSVLSEEAVLGFEYGYAAAEPNALVIWEAQFGDFANGAQVVIDQFISSGEQKWGRLCGLTMFLPHGFEGQGPEHSSARLERYLQLCAQQNMQVCVPSTPSQIFHLIRRQVVRPYRKPLIVMTPKSLLRHKLAVSSLDDLTKGEFRLVIPEIDDIKKDDVRRVVLCSGKVYYDLLEERRKRELKDVAILRVEQLYPFPKKECHAELAKYKKAKEVVWCQEEPKNQGAWFCSKHNIEASLADKQTLEYVGRAFFAAPAVGFASLHHEQQRQLVEEALGVS
jgi:2-oxoglutarate dehydrogenase E1 component